MFRLLAIYKTLPDTTGIIKKPYTTSFYHEGTHQAKEKR